MQARPHGPLDRFVFWAVGCGVALLATLGTLRKIDDPDLFLHLKLGETILQGWALPDRDCFSFTFAGKPFTIDWGGDVVMALLHSHFGETGLFVLAATLGLATLLLVAARMRGLGGFLPAAGAAALLLLVNDASVFRFTPRPQTFLFVFLGALLWLLEHAQARRSLRPLWAIPPLVLIWTNVHLSSNLALIFAGVVGLGQLISMRQQFLPAVLPRWRQWLGLVVATVLAMLATPHPLDKIHTAWSTVFTRSETNAVLTEWLPPPLELWLGPFGALLALVLVAFVLDRRRVKAHEVLLTALTAWMAARHIRFVPIFAVTVGPMIYRHVAALAASRLEKRGWFALDKGLALSLVAAVAVVGRAMDNHSLWLGSFGRPHPRIEGRAYPVRATRFLARERPQGHMYNNFHFGGYLMYHLGPQVQVYVDGRTGNLYDDAHMREMLGLQLTWPAVFARWNIQYAVLRHGEFETALAADPDWSLVYVDDDALVFVRNDGPNAELARRLAYHVFVPPFTATFGSDPEDQARMVAEAQRLVDEAPNSALAHILRGRVRGWQRDGTGFEEDMRTATRLNATQPEPWRRLAMLALSRGEFPQAIENARRALELAPHSKSLRGLLAKAYLAQGDAASARATLRPLAQDESQVDDWLTSLTRARGPAPSALEP